MNSYDLFGREDSLPSGLFLLKNELDPTLLQEILQEIETRKWFENTNQFMRFGPIPAFLDPLVQVGSHFVERIPLFDQKISNRYSVGEGLMAHVDLDRFEDGILIASIKGTCLMEFQHSQLDYLKYSVFLEPGDIVFLTGSSRWDWTHGIPFATIDVVNGISVERTERISITLRKMALDPSGCSL
jgi:hypothetical protein